MQSTGHSSMQALSSTSTHGSAMMYVTGLSLHSHAAISYGGYEPSISPSRRSQVLRRQDVGHRVVVRRIVGSSNDRPLYTDALGELVELTETDLTLATAQGTLRVPLRDVHRAKRVPAARRPPAVDVVALELAADEAWPAPVRARLGAWILRAAENWTGRANSALAIGDPDRPLEAAIDAVTDWYAQRGQQALINAP